MGGAIFQKEGVKVQVTTSKVKITTVKVQVTTGKVKVTTGTKEIIQKMTLKVKPTTRK
jgi:hypothetical protein